MFAASTHHLCTTLIPLNWHMAQWTTLYLCTVITSVQEWQSTMEIAHMYGILKMLLEKQDLDNKNYFLNKIILHLHLMTKHVALIQFFKYRHFS